MARLARRLLRDRRVDKDSISGREGCCAPRSPRRWWWWLGLVPLLAVAGFFLWTEHRAHLLGALPYLLLLACPLMHLLMHRHPDGSSTPHHHGGPS